MRILLCSVAAALIAGCGSLVAEPTPAGNDAAETESPATRTGGLPPSTTTSSGASAAATSSSSAPPRGTSSSSDAGGAAASTTSSEDTGNSTGTCVTPRDPPDLPDYCQLGGEDCPCGFKCAPYNEGQGFPNGRRCVPIDPEAVGPGEECEQQLNRDGGWIGVDNCGDNAVCWDFYDDIPGTCKSICESGLGCDEPQTVPYWGCQECFCICETPCDVLGQNCLGDLMCVLTSQVSTCVVDASGDAGANGDPCEFVNACDPGLLCVSATAVPDCGGSLGCCTPYCDTTAPNCPTGTQCDPLYRDGDAPPFLDNVGMCIL